MKTVSIKTLVLTGYDDGMKEVGDLTSLLMRSYAYFHSFDFRCVREYHQRMHPSFQKMEQILLELESYDRVVWIDADAVITNFRTNLDWFVEDGINVSEDWGKPVSDVTDNHKPLPLTRHFSMGIFVSTKEAIPVFRWVLEQKHWYWKMSFEQSAMQDGATDHGWIRKLVHIHPNRVMNSVDAALGELIDPRTGRLAHEGNPVRTPWALGDWLCHLTGRSNAERLKRIEHYVKTGSF
jgi:hypothetical protein